MATNFNLGCVHVLLLINGGSYLKVALFFTVGLYALYVHMNVYMYVHCYRLLNDIPQNNYLCILKMHSY